MSRTSKRITFSKWMHIRLDWRDGFMPWANYIWCDTLNHWECNDCSDGFFENNPDFERTISEKTMTVLLLKYNT